MINKLKDIICDYTGKQNIEITEASVIRSDLGLSSYDLVQLVCRIEDEFDIEIPDKYINSFKTIGDVIKFIEENEE